MNICCTRSSSNGRNAARLSSAEELLAAMARWRRRAPPVAGDGSRSVRSGFDAGCAWRAAVLLHARLRRETAQPLPVSPWQRLLQHLGFGQPPQPESVAIARQRLRTVILLDRANRYAQELLAATAPAPPR